MAATTIFASILISVCQGDHKDYTWSGETTDCHSVVMNCALNKDLDLITKSKDEMLKIAKECYYAQK